ncbi:MAG: Methionine synthase [Firmicutes bacterium ADurb.Bin193]|nr:MAG: Methionine synthase [Firmicutes bacterium ADurb.Bin193]
MERLVYFDGAMGTMLQKSGLKAGGMPEILNITNPGLITDIHRQYAEAGCDIIKTNTFGANSLKLKDYTVGEVVSAAVENARAAADGRLVALDIGPTGKLLEPMGELSFKRAYEVFGEIVRAGATDADLILIETMSDTYELKAAVLAAKGNSSLPVYATVTVDEAGRLLTGADILSVVALLEGLGVDALGINCGLGPKQIKGLFKTMRDYASIPVIINPNAGLPKVGEDGMTYYEVGPEEFAEDMLEIASSGANIIGGCCGTTPEHIARMVEKTRHLMQKPLNPKGQTVVSSYAGAVIFDEKPIIIGGRINPNVNDSVRNALSEGDMDTITDEAMEQADAGADIVAVNVAIPDINEEEAMTEAVKSLQQFTRLPLMIESESPSVLEGALRLYNGKALISCVSGKKESMNTVFPLVKKYGGVVIALALDENGIPPTAEGRLETAEKIIKNAIERGIDKKDIIIDVCAGAGNPDEGLKALKLIRERLGVKTVLGISKTDIINADFLKEAVNSGLCAAVVDPCNDEIMEAFSL